MPKEIQRSRAKGWRKPVGAVIVDQTSKWGNPYRVVADPVDCWMVVSPAGAVARRIPSKREGHWVAFKAFEKMLRDGADRESGVVYPSVDEVVRELRGRDLVCPCPRWDETTVCPETLHRTEWGRNCSGGWHWAPGATYPCPVCEGTGFSPYPCHRRILMEVANAQTT